MRCNAPDSNHGNRISFVLVCLLLLATVACGYAKIGPAAYELTVALDQAVERQNVEQIIKARELIEQRKSDGEISERDFEYLDQIIVAAERGDWADSRKKARNILKDQVDW